MATFTAPSGTGHDTLAFLGEGNPAGLPPLALVTGIDLQEVPEGNVIPEPGTWLMIGIGLAGIAAFAYRHPEWLRVPA